MGTCCKGFSKMEKTFSSFDRKKNCGEHMWFLEPQLLFEK